ncbi:MAG: hypothetical protein IT445_02335 [Phycisphaeraceae bacterium]|nr:hypothetical protein [Phycisphaeraceae bacterium]
MTRTYTGTMTPQQRGQCTLQLRSTDRAPRYISAIACSVGSALLGRPALTGTGSLRYAEALALYRGPAAHAEFLARFEQDLLDIHRMLDVDVIRMPWRMSVKPSLMIDQHTFLFGDRDASYSVYRYNPDTTDFDAIEIVRRDAPTPPRTPQQISLQTSEALAPMLDFHRRLCSGCFNVIPAGGIGIGLHPDDLLRLAEDPASMLNSTMQQADTAIEFGRQIKASGVSSVMLGGGDLAGSTGPMYSPASFRQVMLPALRQAMNALNDMGIHYVFRTDGNLWLLADMIFADAGCPGYGETDRDAGMTVGALRQRFPRLVIWGNVSSSLLHRGTAEQVRQQCRQILEESQGVGYFHGCSNAIVHGTPPQNVEAMFSVD